MISIRAYCALLFAFAMCAFSFFRIYDKYIELQNENIQLRQSIKYEPTTKNNLGVDCRSLEDIKKLVERKADALDGVMLDAGGVIIGLYFAIANDLTPVTPQEPTKGHWINNKCTNCRYEVLPWNNTPYCPNCGAKMVEPQESEDKE